MPVLCLKHQCVERVMYLHCLSSFHFVMMVLLELWLLDPLHFSVQRPFFKFHKLFRVTKKGRKMEENSINMFACLLMDHGVKTTTTLSIIDSETIKINCRINNNEHKFKICLSLFYYYLECIEFNVAKINKNSTTNQSINK